MIVKLISNFLYRMYNINYQYLYTMLEITYYFSGIIIFVIIYYNVVKCIKNYFVFKKQEQIKLVNNIITLCKNKITKNNNRMYRVIDNYSARIHSTIDSNSVEDNINIKRIDEFINAESIKNKSKIAQINKILTEIILEQSDTINKLTKNNNKLLNDISTYINQNNKIQEDIKLLSNNMDLIGKKVANNTFIIDELQNDKTKILEKNILNDNIKLFQNRYTNGSGIILNTNTSILTIRNGILMFDDIAMQYDSYVFDINVFKQFINLKTIIFDILPSSAPDPMVVIEMLLYVNKIDKIDISDRWSDLKLLSKIINRVNKYKVDKLDMEIVIGRQTMTTKTFLEKYIP